VVTRSKKRILTHAPSPSFSGWPKFPIEEARKTLEKLLKVYAVTHLRMILTPTLIGYEELTTVMESIG
jgi:hypothetical protein